MKILCDEIQFDKFLMEKKKLIKKLIVLINLKLKKKSLQTSDNRDNPHIKYKQTLNIDILLATT